MGNFCLIIFLMAFAVVTVKIIFCSSLFALLVLQMKAAV